MAKPTVHDIAREAGVSLSTVDRVLNGRADVRPKNAERVKAAVERLGYVRDTHAANLAKQRRYKFVFVLPEGPNHFVETIVAAVREAGYAQASDRVDVAIMPVNAGDPHAIVARLQTLDLHSLDGVAIMVPETPQVRDAIAHIREAGIHVVAFVSDLPNSKCDHFVGIDNFSAGQTAGALLGKFLRNETGSILVVTNSMVARDSIERRYGMDEVVSRDFPRLRALPTIEFYDDPQRIRETLAHALTAHPDLKAVYSMGSGNAVMLDALRDNADVKDLVVIAHDLTAVTRQGLTDGEIDAVIAQNVGHLVRSALRVMRAKCDATVIFEAQEQIRIEIILRENLY
ncbi:LacI family DNA-binding transcriptional regulator [Roseibium salinum]|uniref:LacI family DNA-binding transcriptional regulator n=1 Tax=Roseibium salinum TaxID=1604349 RepID=A0ABT3QXY9_9HYPH|nr:LacI family DNA-binding transcriptional regulator [Roseibium sp. DSM 29163]MCX2721787.1 LacI family DNA-binding transcriptional regulator [Roseibium sp. DSM 29163]MDN3720168.1 LacI family DNA-binding transcriptional regulator [Roseibium salinum]